MLVPLDDRFELVRTLGVVGAAAAAALEAFQEEGAGALAIEVGRGAGMPEEAPGGFMPEVGSFVAPNRGRADWRLVEASIVVRL